jgi:hypothetical protein
VGVTSKTAQIRGSEAGRKERDPVEEQRNEATDVVVHPIGRTSLKETVVSLTRLAGKDSDSLLRVSGQSKLLISSTPLERSFSGPMGH